MGKEKEEMELGIVKVTLLMYVENAKSKDEVSMRAK